MIKSQDLGKECQVCVLDGYYRPYWRLYRKTPFWRPVWNGYIKEMEVSSDRGSRMVIEDASSRLRYRQVI